MEMYWACEVAAPGYIKGKQTARTTSLLPSQRYSKIIQEEIITAVVSGKYCLTVCCASRPSCYDLNF